MLDSSWKRDRHYVAEAQVLIVGKGDLIAHLTSLPKGVGAPEILVWAPHLVLGVHHPFLDLSNLVEEDQGLLTPSEDGLGGIEEEVAVLEVVELVGVSNVRSSILGLAVNHLNVTVVVV